MRNKEYNSAEYGKLADFGNNLFNRKLSLEKAINEQKMFLALINQLEKSVTRAKTGRRFTKDNKKAIKEVTENLKQAFETRNTTIDEFENIEGKQEIQTEEDEKTEEDQQTEEDERDQDLPPWIKVSKKRLNEIKNTITKAKKDRLRTKIGNKIITVKQAKNLLETMISNIGSKKIREETISMYQDIVEDTKKL